MTTSRALGDLSSAFLLQRHTANLKLELQQRSTELATGTLADRRAALAGDWRPLAAIEHGLRVTAGQKLAAVEAQGLASAVQAALGAVQLNGEAASAALLAVPDVATRAATERAGAVARQSFEAVAAALDQKVAGRALFAGAATDGRALAPVADMMAAVELAVAGLTEAEDVATAVLSWFEAPGGGFELAGYAGATEPVAPVRLGGGEVAELGATAADPALRRMMAGLAMGALLEGSAFGGTMAEREALSRRAAEAVLTASGGVTDLQASVGQTEAQVERAIVRIAAETSALETTRTGLTGADPYEAATRLEAARAQLETMYALTARVSRLSLVDYLR